MENIRIDITENGTTTLATAGKYCDRNIDVNVEVAGGAVTDADGILDGTFSGEYYSDKITSLRDGAFMYMPNITAISLPNCTRLQGSNTFRNGGSLICVNLPNLISIKSTNYTFSYTNVTEIVFPNLTSATGEAFCYKADKLETVKFPKLSGNTIGATWFGNTALATLVLGGGKLNPLNNTNAFDNTPIAKGTGYIYVPDALVDTYKTATNWVTFADQIKPISELEE